MKIYQTVFNLQSRHKDMVGMATFKSRQTIVTIHEFCTSSHRALNLCEVLSKYVQRAVTPKEGKPELWFLGSTRCLMLLYIYMRFHENISNVFQLTEQTWYMLEMAMLNVQSAITPKVGTRVTVHVFYTSSHVAFDLCEVLWKYHELYQSYSADKSTW